MLLKFALLTLISLPALAQDNCGRVQTSLFEVERGIYNSNLGDVCTRTTARSLGVSESLQAYVDENRCKNLSEVEVELGKLEAELVMIDGLRALKNEVVKTQGELKRRTQWTQESHQLAASLINDVALGASIEELINSDHLPELFANPNIEGPQWIGHIKSFCQSQEQARRVTPFCSSWKTYGPQSSSDRRSAIAPSDVIDFMNDLRASLNPQKQLPAATKNQYLQTLRIKVNGNDSNFQGLSSELEKVDLSTMLTRVDSERSNFNADQVKLIQNITIADSDPSSNSYVSQLRARMKQRRDQAHIELQTNLLRQGFQDEADRLNARVKAKLQATIGSPVVRAACLNLKDGELADCIERTIAEGTDAQRNRLRRSMIEAAKSAAEARNLGEICVRPEMINAFIEEAPSANACAEKIAANRAEVLDKRQSLQNLRKLMSEGVEQDLRFRDAAFEYLKNNCQNVSRTELMSAQCRGIATISTDPMLSLASDTMFALQGGLRASTVLTDRDCPEGIDNKFVVLCEVIHRGQNTPAPIPPPYRGTPETLSTDVSRRPNDGIVLDALAGAANDIGQAYLQRRFQPQNYNPGFQMPQYRPMPYSSPINMSLSDYVMTSAKFYGGYGQYYSCSTCGFGTGPAAFNSYWGMSSTPTPGMGPSGLMGTNLSSRFFGGSSGGAPSMAGSFSF